VKGKRRTNPGWCAFSNHRISFEVPTELAIESRDGRQAGYASLPEARVECASADRPQAEKLAHFASRDKAARAKTWCGFLNNFRRSRHTLAGTPLSEPSHLRLPGRYPFPVCSTTARPQRPTRVYTRVNTTVTRRYSSSSAITRSCDKGYENAVLKSRSL
jgi:hypothetical protein